MQVVIVPPKPVGESELARMRREYMEALMKVEEAIQAAVMTTGRLPVSESPRCNMTPVEAPSSLFASKMASGKFRKLFTE